MAGEQERLSRLAKSWGVALAPEMADALIAYGRLLVDWNQRINLTGAKSLADLIDSHFADSFAVARALAGSPAVLDVGSGGGLPAIPAALLTPEASFTLVEPVRKKVAFLRTAIRVLDLGQQMRVLPTRLEGRIGASLDGAFDVALSRATFEPPAWLSRAVSLVRLGGKVLALTSGGEVPAPTGLRLAESVRYGSTPPRWLLVLIRST